MAGSPIVQDEPNAILPKHFHSAARLGFLAQGLTFRDLQHQLESSAGICCLTANGGAEREIRDQRRADVDVHREMTPLRRQQPPLLNCPLKNREGQHGAEPLRFGDGNEVARYQIDAIRFLPARQSFDGDYPAVPQRNNRLIHRGDSPTHEGGSEAFGIEGRIAFRHGSLYLGESRDRHMRRTSRQPEPIPLLGQSTSESLGRRLNPRLSAGFSGAKLRNDWMPFQLSAPASRS